MTKRCAVANRGASTGNVGIGCHTAIFDDTGKDLAWACDLGTTPAHADLRRRVRVEHAAFQPHPTSPGGLASRRELRTKEKRSGREDLSLRPLGPEPSLTRKTSE